MVEPRFRRSVPSEVNLSDQVILDRFMSEAAIGARRMFEDYTSKGQRIGLESVDGVAARDIVSRVEDDLVRLIDRCVKFCPHIDSVPFPRPHLILPALGVITCLVCADGHLAQVDPDASDCDLCGVDAKTFYELNLQMGPGVLAVNLGECCISRFRP